MPWTPDLSYAGQVFFAGPTVYDDNCPTPHFTYQPILFKVVDLGLEANITDSDCQQATGAIDLDIQGGGVPFDAVWSNGDTTEDLTNLSAGAYTATLTGSNGVCTTSVQYELITISNEPFVHFWRGEVISSSLEGDFDVDL